MRAVGPVPNVRPLPVDEALALARRRGEGPDRRRGARNLLDGVEARGSGTLDEREWADRRGIKRTRTGSNAEGGASAAPPIGVRHVTSLGLSARNTSGGAA
jgi:hypothetical protein